MCSSRKTGLEEWIGMQEADPSDGCSNARREGKKISRPFVHSTERYCLTASTSRSLIYPLSLSDLYRWLIIRSCGTHSLLDLAGHGQEGLFDVAGVLGRGLEEWDTQAVGELL